MKILKSLIFAFTIVYTIAACQKSDEIKPSDTVDILTLKISDEVIVLDITESEELAVTFSWTTGNNYGTGKAILYSLNFAKANEEYDAENAIDLGKHIYSMSYTVGELNDLLMQFSALEAGTQGTYKAQITASVPDEDEVQVSEVEFTATTYRPLPAEISLGGSAMSEDVKMIKGDNGIFIWQGELKAGDIRVYDSVYGIDIQEEVAQDGRYSVIADMKVDSVSVVIDDTIYFVSEYFGWQFMPMEEKELGVYSILCDIKNGQFKFGTIPNVWHYMYVSSVSDNAPWDSTEAIFREELKGAQDWKWFIWNSEKVPYEITLDLTGENPKMIMIPFHTEISMIGSATVGEWSLDDRTKLTRNDGMIFTWTGYMNVGEMKFACGTSPEYGKGEWFMPMTDKQEFAPMENEKIQLVNAAEEGAADFKWEVKKAGEYSISLNQYTHELTITEAK